MLFLVLAMVIYCATCSGGAKSGKKFYSVVIEIQS